jgi:hypothetical protein
MRLTVALALNRIAILSNPGGESFLARGVYGQDFYNSVLPRL